MEINIQCLVCRKCLVSILTLLILWQEKQVIVSWVMTSPFSSLLSGENWHKALFPDPGLMALTGYQDFLFSSPYIFFLSMSSVSEYKWGTWHPQSVSTSTPLYSLHPLWPQTPKLDSTEPSLLWLSSLPFWFFRTPLYSSVYNTMPGSCQSPFSGRL